MGSTDFQGKEGTCSGAEVHRRERQQEIDEEYEVGRGFARFVTIVSASYLSMGQHFLM